MMSKGETMSNITRGFNKVLFSLKKHSPEIMVVAGVVGMTTSAVLACKATTKAGAILEETKETIHDLHLVAAAAGVDNDPDIEYTSEDLDRIEVLSEHEEVKNYTENDYKKDTTIVYAQTAGKFLKLYGPSIALGVASIACILAGHNITKKRNAALTAAYATVSTSFKEYRKRVVDRFGKELDKELKYNIKSKEVEETVTDKKGKEKTVKKTVDVIDVDDPNEYSEYARFFEPGSEGWEDDAEYRLTFLKLQQNQANELLRSKGYLFLNEVYDMLGIPRTKAGQIVGWVYDETNPESDNFVDFGIWDVTKPKARDFVNGYEQAILLDFNVDGNIWELMK